MLGKRGGVATKLLDTFPQLIVWHCLNHRLELAVGDSVKDVTEVNHFKAFLDTLYALYNQSPKNQRELAEAATDVEAKLQKIGRVLDVRWSASSFRTVKAVWNSYSALHKHFENASEDTSRVSKVRTKYKGLMVRLESPEFLSDLALMYDVLEEELSSLSLKLQDRSVTK